MDQDFFTTVTTRGHIICRADTMQSQLVTPDDFRPALFPVTLLPPHFQREHVDVMAGEDGNTLEYVVVDREQGLNIPSNMVELGVTRIEATHEVLIGRPPPEDVLFSVLGQGFRSIAGSLMTSISGGPGLQPWRDV